MIVGEKIENSGLCRPGKLQSENERKKRDKYLDLARELKKKPSNIKVTVIRIIIGALRTILKRLAKGLEELEMEGRAETIENT